MQVGLAEWQFPYETMVDVAGMCSLKYEECKHCVCPGNRRQADTRCSVIVDKWRILFHNRQKCFRSTSMVVQIKAAGEVASGQARGELMLTTIF